MTKLKTSTVLLLALILAGLYFYTREVSAPTTNQPLLKTYENKTLGYSFQYPENLKLSETSGVPKLEHSIAYKNNGPCDMVGDEKTYDTLTDFEVTFKISNDGNKWGYTDGQYKAGSLNGIMVYAGAEYCGISEYYFPTPDGKYLVVTRNSIQALHLSSKDEVLKVPGVISNEENDKIFNQILSTFKFTK